MIELQVGVIFVVSSILGFSLVKVSGFVHQWYSFL